MDINTTRRLSAKDTRPVLLAGQRPKLLFRVWDKQLDAAGKLTVVREWTVWAKHPGEAWAMFVRLYPDCDPAGVQAEIYRRGL